MEIKTLIGEKKVRDLACSLFNRDEDAVIEIDFKKDNNKITAFSKIK